MQVTTEGEEEGDGFTAVGKGGKSVQYTSESIFKVLAQVNENRGKKACPYSIHSLK
jgi:translation initiation factor 3 subunit C